LGKATAEEVGEADSPEGFQNDFEIELELLLKGTELKLIKRYLPSK